MITRAKWLAGLGTLALAGGPTGLALARPTPTPTPTSTLQHSRLGQYIVRLTVPKTEVREGTGAKITAHGNAAEKVHLEVFTSRYKPAGIREKCFRDAELEKANDGHSIINRLVTGSFSSDAVTYAKVKGTWYACAYLYATPGSTLARAEGEWREVK